MQCCRTDLMTSLGCARSAASRIAPSADTLRVAINFCSTSRASYSGEVIAGTLLLPIPTPHRRQNGDAKMARDAGTPCPFDCADAAWRVNVRYVPCNIVEVATADQYCTETPWENHTLRLNRGGTA